jgi:curved DNA-binding protein CbpA
MKNLYDLLGARPDDDNENLRKAYLKAAKESHPDHHRDDPEAAMRFRQIAVAYKILRDADQRSAYHRLLEFERRPLHHKSKPFRSDVKRRVVYASAFLAVVLAIGYEWFAPIPEKLAGGKSDVTAPVVVVSRDSESNVPTGAGITQKAESEPPVRHDVPSLEIPFSSVEERNSVQAAYGTRNGKMAEPAGANAGDVKIPDINVSARPPKVVKRRAVAVRRPLFEQAPPDKQTTLDNRNTSACAGSQSCPVSVPPFFGFGP